MHLLYLVHRIPYPPNKGDKIRSFHLLRFLARRYRVHLGAFIDDDDDVQYIEKLQHYCEDCKFVRLNPKRARLKSLTGLASGAPLSLAYYKNAEMDKWVDNALAKHPIRHAIVFSSAMAQYVEAHDSLMRIADFVDIDSDKWRQYAASRTGPLAAIYAREARTLLAYERRIAAEFDATFFVTNVEAKLFKQLAPESGDRIHFMNNGVDIDYFSPERDYTNPYPQNIAPIVFTGAMDYWANVDAVVWFAREVFAPFVERFPHYQFYIVGAKPAKAVNELQSIAGVVVTGRVPDVRPYLAHAAVAVAPLRIARGTQNKVLEAMAMGCTVIASTSAAEGVSALRGSDLLVASDEHMFFEFLERHAHDALDVEIGKRARARVAADYQWDKNLSIFEHCMETREKIPASLEEITIAPAAAESR